MAAPEERRKFEADTHDRIMEIESQLDFGDKRMERIEKKLDEVYEIVSAAKGFFKVLGVIATGVKWLMLMTAAIAAAWAAFKTK